MLTSCLPHSKKNVPVPVIPAYLNETNHNAMLNQLPCRAWWQAYQDPELNQLVDKALSYNNDITIAKQSIRVAQAELKTIQLNWLPGVSFLMGYSQNPAFGNPGVFYGVLPSFYQNIFMLYYQQKKAQYLLQRSRDYYLGVRLAVIGQVVNSYFSLLGWHQQLQLLTQMEHDTAVILASIRTTQTKGLANQRQWLTVNNQLQEIRGLKKQLQSNLVASENALHYLLNESPGHILVKRSLTSIPSHAVPIEKINVQVLLRRPDMAVAVDSLRAACSGVSIASSQLLPAVTLDYLAGQASMDGTFKIPTHYPRYSDLYATFDLSPTIIGQIMTNKAIFHKSLAEYQNVLQNALRVVANSLDVNEKAMAKWLRDDAAYQSIKKRYQLQEKLYQQGLISHNDLLASRIELNQQAFKLTLSKLAQLSSVVGLYQELAAGILYQAKSHLCFSSEQ